jgi:hypothetical protein
VLKRALIVVVQAVMQEARACVVSRDPSSSITNAGVAGPRIVEDHD